ncbi:hypothetical protein ABZZ36_38155 [Actinacidiphila glaucinigra]|uniref:hypothetical protein n=1 Tax=Actinacidiphila glaucinigra TaxID=235986 RepID=UPI0033ADA4EF
MKLGEKILHELDATGTGDTLTRWLSHHIADLITKADHVRTAGTAEEATRAAEQCRGAILDLWAHRTDWPNGWPPPGARRMAEILNSIDEPAFGFRQGRRLSALQRLHHQVLTALADEGTAGEPVDAEQDWLESYGQLLDVDDRALLALYAGRDDRTAAPSKGPRAEQPADAGPRSDGPAGPVPQVHRAVDLADRYRETVSSLLADNAKDTPTEPH